MRDLNCINTQINIIEEIIDKYHDKDIKRCLTFIESSGYWKNGFLNSSKEEKEENLIKTLYLKGLTAEEILNLTTEEGLTFIYLFMN